MILYPCNFIRYQSIPLPSRYMIAHAIRNSKDTSIEKNHVFPLTFNQSKVHVNVAVDNSQLQNHWDSATRRAVLPLSSSSIRATTTTMQSFLRSSDSFPPRLSQGGNSKRKSVQITNEVPSFIVEKSAFLPAVQMSCGPRPKCNYLGRSAWIHLFSMLDECARRPLRKDKYSDMHNRKKKAK